MQSKKEKKYSVIMRIQYPNKILKLWMDLWNREN